MRKIFYIFLILLAITAVNSVNAQPSPPTLQLPANGDTNVSLHPTFQWTNVTGATYYHLRVFSGPLTVLDTNYLTSNTFTVTQDIFLPSTYYYWTVASGNTSGEGIQSNSFIFRTTLQIPTAPILLTPANGSTVSLTPYLDWNTVAGTGITYRVQVSTSPAFVTTVINVGGLPNSGYQVQPGVLSNSVTYYWRVNATNTGGTGPWSDTWNFLTQVAAPIAPTLYYPSNGATGIPVTLTFRWLRIPNATSYHLQVSQSQNFPEPNVIEVSTADTFYTVPVGVLSGNTQYYWHVNASNAGGSGPYSVTRNFTTGTAPPAAPVLVVPVNAATCILTTGVLFDWNNVAGATSYRIQISLDPNFGTLFVNVVTTTSQYTHNTPAFAFNTTYYWRVNATNSAGQGQWSTVWNFHTVEASLLPPTLVSPLNGATGVSLTPTLDWSDVTNATGYRLQVSTNPGFSSYVINIELPSSPSQYTIPSGTLQGLTTYYWRVATENGCNIYGNNSGAWNFTTLQTIYLNLKVFFEGFYNGSTGTQVPDTAKIILARNISPYAGWDTSLAFIGSDGSASLISFAKAISGTYYYIVVQHRNHLETWSKNAIQLSTGGAIPYDFTTAATQAFGDNMKLVGTAWVLYAGDANQDYVISTPDYDMFKIQFGMWGYKACDFNGDWFVDGYDLLIINNNFGHSRQKPN